MVCVELDAAEDAPPESAFWEAFLARFEHVGLATRNAHEESAEDALVAQRRKYLDLRGVDERYPKPTFAWLAVPRTTNADALALATYWTTRLAMTNASHPGKLDDIAQRWNANLAKIASVTKGASASGVYANNDELWSAMRDVAVAIDPIITAAAAASLVGRAGDIITGVFDDLPGTLKRGAEAAAHGAGALLGDAASGIGDVAGKAVKGFLGELATPLLVVGGGVAALYLLTRGERAEEV
jgi:hypothetical protein